MDEDAIRFSVVCAAYNARETVVRAVGSCVYQTHPPHEIIVVDDASTDDTVAVLETAFGAQIRIVLLAQNGGPSAARNAGMNAATGNFIALQDADDWWEPQKLERVASAIQSTGAGFIFHRYALGRTKLPASGLPRRLPRWRLLLGNVVATPCAVFSAEANQRFDERLRWMEDWDFFLRLEEDCGAWLLDEPLTVLGRPVLSAGGLSAARGKMRAAERSIYAKWARRRWWRSPLLPPLWIWSWLKAARKTVRRG